MKRFTPGAYQELEIASAAPEKLIAMLYDGAVNYLDRAKENLNGDLMADGESMGKAISIICELMGSVNSDAQELTTDLRNLYAFFIRKLIEADFNKDEKGINEVISLMTDLRGSWLEAAEKNSTG